VPVLLVVGAAGFIGRHVTDAARSLPGVRVLGAGRAGAPLAFAGAFEQDWRPIDLSRDPVDIAERFHELRPAVVVNCAGATYGSMSGLVAANVVATAHLLEGLERSGIGAHLVHVGSAAEYGSGLPGVPVSESAALRPVGAYGISKLCGTQLVTAEAGAGRIEAIVLRVFNALGPGMPEGSLVGSAVRRLGGALASKTDTIDMGPLDAVRDFVDVRDVADAIVRAASLPVFEAPIVNVGSGTGHAARDLVHAIARRLGFTGSIREGSDGSPRSSDVPWQVAEPSLARRILSWEPRYDFETTVEVIARAGAER
jgi:nucleoside-diphosphate-sugar epimerase